MKIQIKSKKSVSAAQLRASSSSLHWKTRQKNRKKTRSAWEWHARHNVEKDDASPSKSRWFKRGSINTWRLKVPHTPTMTSSHVRVPKRRRHRFSGRPENRWRNTETREEDYSEKARTLSVKCIQVHQSKDYIEGFSMDTQIKAAGWIYNRAGII